jgi:hypothetical protein
LLSAIRIALSKAQLLHLCLVLIKEMNGIQSLKGLLPHFHNKEVGIKGIVSLL